MPRADRTRSEAERNRKNGAKGLQCHGSAGSAAGLCGHRAVGRGAQPGAPRPTSSPPALP